MFEVHGLRTHAVNRMGVSMGIFWRRSVVGAADGVRVSLGDRWQPQRCCVGAHTRGTTRPRTVGLRAARESARDPSVLGCAFARVLRPACRVLIRSNSGRALIAATSSAWFTSTSQRQWQRARAKGATLWTTICPVRECIAKSVAGAVSTVVSTVVSAATSGTGIAGLRRRRPPPSPARPADRTGLVISTPPPRRPCPCTSRQCCFFQMRCGVPFLPAPPERCC